MNKNAIKNTRKNLFNLGFDFMLAGIIYISSYIIKIFANIPPLVLGAIIFIIVICIMHLINEIRWRYKEKRGFVIISPKSSMSLNEEEKYLWIEASLKDEYDVLKINVVLKRLSLGKSNEYADLSIGKENKCFTEEINVERFPKKILIANGIEDNITFLLNETNLIYKATRPFEKTLLKGDFEIIVEIQEKINEIYVFSELYKGNINYVCTKEPNIFVGQDQEPHRSSYIEWEKFERWSKKDEENRELLRKENMLKPKILKNILDAQTPNSSKIGAIK